MKNLLSIALILLSLPAAAKLKVVATLPDLGAIAHAVGGDAIQIEVLARYSQDPHYVDAKPSLVLSVSRANLLIANGLDLEVGWLPALLTSSRNGSIQPGSSGYLDCSTVVSLKEVPMRRLDRSMGDIHPGGNPHYTYDPRNAIPVARAILQRLSALDSAHETLYQSNEEDFEKSLNKRIRQWQDVLAPFKGLPVVTYHKSWIYFSDFAGLQEVGYLEPKPGIPPNPAHVATVFSIIKAKHVPLILQEEWYSAQTGELLARKSGARLVRIPGMTLPGQSYVDHIQQTVTAVAKALAAGRAEPEK